MIIEAMRRSWVEDKRRMVEDKRRMVEDKEGGLRTR